MTNRRGMNWILNKKEKKFFTGELDLQKVIDDMVYIKKIDNDNNCEESTKK